MADFAAIEFPLVATASLRPISQAALDATTHDHDRTTGYPAADDRLASLAHTDVVIAFPLLAVAAGVASSSADPDDDNLQEPA